MRTTVSQLDRLDEMLKDIEIPPQKYDEAEDRYRQLGEWLDRDNSSIKKYSPKIYPQGSFRMGTAIKPLSGDDGFDVDLVCELDLKRSQITQNNLKHLIGSEMELYRRHHGFKKPVEDGRRCWTIEYSDGSKFHMDVLPAISDSGRFRERLLEAGHRDFARSVYIDTAISITDNTRLDYGNYTDDWPQSNPIGYSNWFFERAKERSALKKKAMMESLASVEELPNYKANTPLQQTVKILKRHRDALFRESHDDKPISVIISTIAAKLYGGETVISSILFNFATLAESQIEQRDGEYYIPNPVNPMENFADKWREHPSRKEAFYYWIGELKQDLANLSTNTSIKRKGSKVSIEEAFAVNMPNSEVRPVFLGSGFIPPLPLSKITPSHRLPLPAPERLDQNATVAISCHEGDGRFNWNEIKPFNEVRKGRSIIFEATLNASWVPDKVEWQVVNTGREAESNTCLRGDFYPSSSASIANKSYKRKETTSYAGTHCVECLFYRDGRIAARTGDFIISIV